jgi:hypothetical protein
MIQQITNFDLLVLKVLVDLVFGLKRHINRVRSSVPITWRFILFTLLIGEINHQGLIFIYEVTQIMGFSVGLLLMLEGVGSSVGHCW